MKELEKEKWGLMYAFSPSQVDQMQKDFQGHLERCYQKMKEIISKE